MNFRRGFFRLWIVISVIWIVSCGVQHEQDVVLVLAGIHAAAQFIAGSPQRRVEVRFLDGHDQVPHNSDVSERTDHLGMAL